MTSTTSTGDKSIVGQLSFRTCRECEAIVLRVDGETRYYPQLEAAPLPLKDWLAEDANTSNKGKLVYVFYRPGDRVVTRVVLDAGT